MFFTSGERVTFVHSRRLSFQCRTVRLGHRCAPRRDTDPPARLAFERRFGRLRSPLSPVAVAVAPPHPLRRPAPVVAAIAGCRARPSSVRPARVYAPTDAEADLLRFRPRRPRPCRAGDPQRQRALAPGEPRRPGDHRGPLRRTRDRGVQPRARRAARAVSEGLSSLAGRGGRSPDHRVVRRSAAVVRERFSMIPPNGAPRSSSSALKRGGMPRADAVRRLCSSVRPPGT